jgi:ATP-dependent Zn protease
MKNIFTLVVLISLFSCSKKIQQPAPKTLAQICNDSFPARESIVYSTDTVYKASEPQIITRTEIVTKEGETVTVVKYDTIYQSTKVIDYINKKESKTTIDSSKIKSQQEVIYALEGKIKASELNEANSKIQILKLRGNYRTSIVIAVSEFLLLLLIALFVWYIWRKSKKIF